MNLRLGLCLAASLLLTACWGRGGDEPASVGQKAEAISPQSLDIALDGQGKTTRLPDASFGTDFPEGEAPPGVPFEPKDVPAMLQEACEKAPREYPVNRLRVGRLAGQGDPVPVLLRWVLESGRCQVTIGKWICGADLDGIEKARNEVKKAIAVGARGTEIDAGSDVPMRWVMEAVRMADALGARPILFTASPDPLGKEKAAEATPVKIYYGSDERGDFGPDVQVCLRVDPGAPFRFVRYILVECARIGVYRIYVKEKPGERIDVFLPMETQYASVIGEPAHLARAGAVAGQGDDSSSGKGTGPASSPGPEETGNPPGMTAAGEGGVYIGRLGGKRQLRALGGGRHTESAVLMGLVWLKNHQNPDGLWSCRRFMANCKTGACGGPESRDEYDLGVTGLAMLAFLGAGHTHKHGKFQEVLQSAIQALLAAQGPDGCIGAKTPEGRWIYNHAIGTAALAEACCLSGDPALRAPAEKAVAFLADCRNPFLGWRYGLRPGDNDSSCTAWAALALVSARKSGLEVPKEAFDGALAWFDKATDGPTGKTRYTSPVETDPRLPEAAGNFQPNEAMTAAAAACRIFILGEKAADRAEILGGGDRLKMNPPRWDVSAGMTDFHCWYWGTLAMFQLGGDYWKSWNEPLKNALVPTQKREGCENGSWDPVDVWGCSGGRVYSTAINVLTMEIYYRYARVMKTK